MGDRTDQGRVLVASAFEAELQPLASACLAGAMRDQATEVAGWDAHMFGERVPTGPFDLALLSVQQFEGLERGLTLADRIRDEGLANRVVAIGQYAQLNSGAFLDRVDAIAFDEPERIAEPLAAAARYEVPLDELPGVLTRSGLRPRLPRQRMSWQLPARDLFPSLVHYPAHHTKYGLMGNIEATRGCHHKCTYCSVYGAYDGGVAPIEVESVVADAVALADEGVRHFCFIDAEFLNSRTIGVRAMERIADEVGPCTFEFTTRVDHVLQYTSLFEHLVELGLKQVTSALEFPSNRILRIFDKGITVTDMRAAIAEAERIGFELNPTFIPFTPWVTYEELLGFEDFLVDTGLARIVDPTALQTRLLLFKGSPLLDSPWLDGVRTVDRGFYLEWTHPDPRVEELWAERRNEAEDVGKVRCCVKC